MGRLWVRKQDAKAAYPDYGYIAGFGSSRHKQKSAAINLYEHQAFNVTHLMVAVLRSHSASLKSTEAPFEYPERRRSVRRILSALPVWSVYGIRNVSK